MTTHIRKLAHQACAASKWFGLMSGKCAKEEDEEVVIQRQIEALREHIYSHIIWYLKINSILIIHEATCARTSPFKTLQLKCLFIYFS